MNRRARHWLPRPRSSPASCDARRPPMGAVRDIARWQPVRAEELEGVIGCQQQQALKEPRGLRLGLGRLALFGARGLLRTNAPAPPGAGDLYACRHCYRLAYASQQDISRSRKIRMSLGGSADLCQPLPAKPHGMHRSTYHRLRARGEAADRMAFGQLRFPRGLLRRYQAPVAGSRGRN
jgi:hypothetical protein